MQGGRVPVPVTPTYESQVGTGIDNPLVSCFECDAVWRSEECTRCPRCARQVGTRYLLNGEQTDMLITTVFWAIQSPHGSEYDKTMMRNILIEDVPWYYEDCRRTIQACYVALCMQQPHPKIAFAIEFFKEAYLHAPEDALMYKFDNQEEYYESDLDEWY
jgi:hypothetical protein